MPRRFGGRAPRPRLGFGVVGALTDEPDGKQTKRSQKAEAFPRHLRPSTKGLPLFGGASRGHTCLY